jgi:NADH-quinone oxidoreductase subunit A
VPAEGDTRGRHNVRFYLVAMLFLVFDVELIFLYPWVLLYHDLDDKLFLFVELVVFIGILAVGYVYAWRKGALDWTR